MQQISPTRGQLQGDMSSDFDVDAFVNDIPTTEGQRGFLKDSGFLVLDFGGRLVIEMRPSDGLLNGQSAPDRPQPTTSDS